MNPHSYQEADFTYPYYFRSRYLGIVCGLEYIITIGYAFRRFLYTLYTFTDINTCFSSGLPPDTNIRRVNRIRESTHRIVSNSRTRLRQLLPEAKSLLRLPFRHPHTYRCLRAAIITYKITLILDKSRARIKFFEENFHLFL